MRNLPLALALSASVLAFSAEYFKRKNAEVLLEKTILVNGIYLEALRRADVVPTEFEMIAINEIMGSKVY